MRPKTNFVTRLRQSIIYQPLAVFLALILLPGLSWLEAGAGPWALQASAFPPSPSTDTTAPSAPGSLTAGFSLDLLTLTANLNWTASADPDSPNITYHVEFATETVDSSGFIVNGTGFTEIKTTTATSFSDQENFNPTSGQTVSYRVRASDPSGNFSSYSDIVQYPTPPGTGGKIIQKYYACGQSGCNFTLAPDLVQLESDAVNAYLAAHNLPASDAHIVYDYGRVDLRNAIRGNMMAILLGIIGKPAVPCPNATPSSSCRTTHEQNLYNWMQLLVQGNEVQLYTAAISQYHAWQANPCTFTLDSQLASATNSSYDSSPWCQPGSELPPSPTVPPFGYFIGYGMEHSYGKPAGQYPNFAKLVSGTSVNVTEVAGIFTAAGVLLGATATGLLAASFAAVTAFAASGLAGAGGLAVTSAAFALSAPSVAAIGGAAAAAAGVAAIILIGVAIGVASLIELLDYTNTISSLDGMSSTLTQVTNTPPDLTTFLDSTGQFKLNQALVSQTVPDIPSTATLPTHQATDRDFAITPQNSTETVSTTLTYADWSGNNWSAQTYGGWFVQTCTSATGCPQADSIIASIRYVDWNGVNRMASRIGDKFVITKQKPASTDVSCPADPTAGVTLGSTSSCLSYVDTQLQLKAADGTLETVSLIQAAPTSITVSANPITYDANGSVTVTVSSTAGTPTGNVSLSVDAGPAISKALDGSGSATFTISSPSATTHTLSASYAAQGSFAASTGSGTLQVNLSSTATSITSALTAATVTGQGYSVGVSVAAVAPGAGSPTGTVTVSDGSASCNATLSGGSGACTVTSTTAGPKTITATYNSDGNYLSTSTTGAHTVNKADTGLIVSSSETPATFGDSLLFTAALSVKTPGSGTPTGAISWTIDGQSAGTGSTLSIATLSAGTHTVSASYPGDSNFNSSSGMLANGQKVNGYPVVATLTAPSQQYSDQETFAISVPNTMVNGQTATTAGTVVTFYVGTQNMGTCTLASSGGSNTCSVTAALIEPSATAAGAPTGSAPNGQMAPGNRTVTVNYTVGSNFLVTGNSITLPIAQENATAVYTGNTFYGVGTATSGPIVLTATIQDPAATTSDGSYGDVRNARVTFVDRLTGNVFSGCANLPVGLISSSDSTVGSASCTTTAALGTYQVATLVGYSDVSTVNHASYYSDNNSSEDTNVTVAQTGPGQITGGGFLQLTNASGQLSPTDNGTGAQSHQNFGFSVASNKSQTNLQGHLNAIVRSQVDVNGNACSVSHPGYTTCVYQVKSTSIGSLTVVQAPNTLCPANTPTGSECASFTSNGVINDITLPNSSTGIDGNVTLMVNMVDTGNKSTDMISFQVNASSNKGGGLWYSNYWTGTRTSEQGLAGGGLSAQ